MTPAMENTIGIQNSKTSASFLSGLFSFDNFITARLVKILYTVGVALILLATVGGGLIMTLGGLYAMFSYGGSGMFGQFFGIVFRLIGLLIGGALGILVLRLYCEFLMVIFKINENLQFMRDRNA